MNTYTILQINKKYFIYEHTKGYEGLLQGKEHTLQEVLCTLYLLSLCLDIKQIIFKNCDI